MLEHFSPEAQEYIKDPKNWPDEAFGVWQTNLGIVGFFRKQGIVNQAIKLYYCDDGPVDSNLVEITRDKLFLQPSDKQGAVAGGYILPLGAEDLAKVLKKKNPDAVVTVGNVECKSVPADEIIFTEGKQGHPQQIGHALRPNTFVKGRGSVTGRWLWGEPLIPHKLPVSNGNGGPTIKKWSGQGAARVYPNGTRRYVGIDPVTGKWGSSDSVEGPFEIEEEPKLLEIEEEPKLPTLITNGQWFPIYDTPGFESVLKRRGVSAERMVRLLMSDGGISRPSATVIHNMFVDLTIGKQRYEWELDEPTVISSDVVPKSKTTAVVTGATTPMQFYNCSKETLQGILKATDVNLDSYAQAAGLERRIEAGCTEICYELDDELRSRILKSLEKQPDKSEWDNTRYKK